MKEKWRSAAVQIAKDIRKNYIAGIVILCYLPLCNLLFGSACPMQIICGLPCPGCGMTRAALALMKGQFALSFHLQPFLLAWIGLLGYWLFCHYVQKKEAKHGMKILLCLIFAMVIFYIYRMIRYFPRVEPMVWYHATFIKLPWNPY